LTRGELPGVRQVALPPAPEVPVTRREEVKPLEKLTARALYAVVTSESGD
jgi:hypothetical protein